MYGNSSNIFLLINIDIFLILFQIIERIHNDKFVVTMFKSIVRICLIPWREGIFEK